MHKKMTITLDEAVYDGLFRVVGRRNISQFLIIMYTRVFEFAVSINYLVYFTCQQ